MLFPATKFYTPLANPVYTTAKNVKEVCITSVDLHNNGYHVQHFAVDKPVLSGSCYGQDMDHSRIYDLLHQYLNLKDMNFASIIFKSSYNNYSRNKFAVAFYTKHQESKTFKRTVHNQTQFRLFKLS